MELLIIRHAKVNFHWHHFSNSKQFNKDCNDYDAAPIKRVNYHIPYNRNSNFYISSLSRTRATAEQLFGEQDYQMTSHINEVQTNAGIDISFKIPLVLWMMIARIQWWCNSSRQKETRQMTIDRAEQFIKLVESNEKDCIVVTHGFFMVTLLDRFKKHGFKVSKTKLHFKNGECVKVNKDNL